MGPHGIGMCFVFWNMLTLSLSLSIGTTGATPLGCREMLLSLDFCFISFPCFPFRIFGTFLLLPRRFLFYFFLSFWRRATESSRVSADGNERGTNRRFLCSFFPAEDCTR